MGPIIVLIILIVIGVAAVKVFLPEVFLEKEKKSSYIYKRKDFLMSRAEHELFDVLVEVVGNQYYVFPLIHLSTILDNKVVGQNWRGAFRHIDEKSVDYVICDKAYLKPLLAIELDDSSHDREDRMGRDMEVERILGEAQMPLLRFGNNGNFNKEEIKRLVLEKLK